MDPDRSKNGKGVDQKAVHHSSPTPSLSPESRALRGKKVGVKSLCETGRARLGCDAERELFKDFCQN